MRINFNIERIASIILADEYQYVYDPDHRNKPMEGEFFETDRGWSNDPKDATTQESKEYPYKLTSLDNEYFDAVRNNDTEKLNSMVESMAREAGYSTPSYHGSPEHNIDIFNNQETASAYFFTPDRESAEYYTGHGSGRVYSVFLNLGKNADWDDLSMFNEIAKEAIWDLEEEPTKEVIDYVFDSLENSKHKFDEDIKIEIERILSKGKDFKTLEKIIDELEYSGEEKYVAMANRVKEFIEKSEKTSNAINQARDTYENSPGQDWYLNYQEDFLKASENLGYDSSTLTDAKGGGGVSTSYAIFKPNLIKSSDTIIKDDNGNIIPLSQRFNSKSNDIRY